MSKRRDAVLVSLTPALVSVVTVVAYVDTHSLHPFLSRYALSMGASVAMAGLIIAAYSVFEDLFELVVGYLMDKLGHKRIFIVVGMLGDALIMLLYASAAGPFALLGVRLLHGFSGSIAGPGIMSLMSEIPHPLSKVGARMGLYGTSIILASVVGWVLGGLVAARLGYGVFFAVVSCLLVVGAVLACLIREPEPLFPRPAGAVSLRDALSKVGGLLRKRGIQIACLGIFSHMATMGAMTALLPLRFEELGLSSFHVGMTLTAYGLAALVFQLPMGVFSERYGRMRTLSAGLATVTIAMVLLSVVETFPLFVAVGGLYGAGYSLLFPTLSSLIIEKSAVGERATAASLFHITFTQGVVLGSFAFSLVAHAAGHSWGLRASAALPFVLLALLPLLRRNTDAAQDDALG